MAASAMSGRLTLSDPHVQQLAQASCVHEKYYDALPKLQGEANWQGWSDALQHAALMAGTDAVLNGELKHPQSLEGKQCTNTEWNDNIKRTAIWRSRNESLLKAMRGAANIDFADFGASNAHDTYVSLRSRYHASDNQRAFRLFSEKLVVGFELNDSPKEIANQLQDAFNQYNQLAGDNVEQRLPENFLKMAFLASLNCGYGAWRKAVLRERDVLALSHGSAMTLNELVDLALSEQAQLLQEQMKMTKPVLAPPPQQAAKRNISQVDEPATLDIRRPCSLPHHPHGEHTNESCMTQNPRLRSKDWKPSKADQIYIAKHSGIETPQLRDSSHDESDNGSKIASEDDSGSDSESDSEDDVGSDSENEDASEPKISAEGEDDTSAGCQHNTLESQNHNDEVSLRNSTADRVWRRFAAARYAEVQAQIDAVTRGVGETFGKKPPKNAPSLASLCGKWLLYEKDHVPGMVKNCHIELWKAPVKEKKTTKKRKKPKRVNLTYQGKLTVESHGHSKTFDIPIFLPSGRVSSRPLPMHFRRSGAKPCGGEVTFWGKGKMIVTIPAPVLEVARRKGSKIEFAGIQSDLVVNPPVADAPTNTTNFDESSDDESDSDGGNDNGSDDDNRDGASSDDENGGSADNQSAEYPNHSGHVEAADVYDRIIRTYRSSSVSVKIKQEDPDTIMDVDDQGSTAVVIKTEEPKASDSDDGWADDVACIMDTVQKQKDSLRGGLMAPLQYLPGVWSFHSPDYKQERGQGIQIFFYDRVDHDSAEQICAPGHCKASTDQIRYCGELRFKAKRGERDWSCRIQQFDVPEKASVVPVKIQSWDTLNKRTILITAWFLGGGAMSMSIPATYIPNYQGQKSLITFSGLKRG